MKKDPKNYLKNNQHEKFGKITEEGELSVPNYFTLKWFPSFFWNKDEFSSVIFMYILTLSFCATGLILF